MIYTTLNTITEDLLKIIRGSIVTNAEPISKRQIEDWVHQYRGVLLKQDLDKGYYPNPDYIQELSSLSLEDSQWVDYWKTIKNIPKTIDLKYKSGITWVGDDYMREISLIPSSRAPWQGFKRHSSNEQVAFLEGNRMHISKTPEPLTSITIKGIFENPMEVIRFVAPPYDEEWPNKEVPYPIPNNKLSALKEMILTKEVKVIATAPIDTTTDNKHNPKPV